MENIQRFGNAMTSIGISVIRQDDETLLYMNEKMRQMQPKLCLGELCSMDYLKAVSACDRITKDDYMWEGMVPAYIITVVQNVQPDDWKESERYSRMMEKAATVMSESLAYGNFTRGTCTKYEETDRGTVHQGIVLNLQESFEKLMNSIYPDDRVEFAGSFSIDGLKEQIENGEKEIYGEFRKKRGERYQWVSIRCISIENSFDEDELCIFIIRDIHKRKQMERQLAIQLNATYQAIPGGVLIMQMDKRMSIINASQSFYDMMGKSIEDYDNGYLAHILSADRKSVQKKISTMSQLGAPFDIIYREADSKHQIHWVQARGTKISDEDGCPVYLVIRMDVTALKDAQQQLIEEQKQYRIYTEGIIDTLSNLVEFRDLDSGEHIKRTRTLTRILMHKIRDRSGIIQLSDESIEKIADAAALHDVGKIVISDTILNKPGKLTNDEFEEMKKHTVKGYEILKKLNLTQDEEQRKYSLDISRYHHERWDGKGYPDHLEGDQIPIWSQVVSIVDVYDALVSPRVYKKAYSHEKALEMILNGECGSFNPVLLDCLKESVELLEKEYHKSA